MPFAILLVELCCDFLIHVGLLFVVSVYDFRRWLIPKLRRMRGSLRQLLLEWRIAHNLARRMARPRGARPWNRTPDHREEQLIRLHVQLPQLGAGQLRLALWRLFGWMPARETVRQIIIRRQDLFFEILEARKRPPRQITVHRPLSLWGMDLALVWILGFFPIWLMCVVDYHGSRLVVFEPLAFPTAAQVRGALERAIAKHGAPQRLISDRAPVFRAQPVADLLAENSIRHVLTRPAHPWTNGRCERIWRTFRETIRAHFWLIASVAQLRRICADFLRWYNQDRPHSSWQGRTPDEVHFGRTPQRATGMVSYFDGRMLWYRVGLG